MGQSESIQSSKPKTSREQQIIDLLVNNYTPQSVAESLKQLMRIEYGIEDDGSRRTEVLLVRAAISNALRQMTPFTVMMIGKAIGKNHSTVIHQAKMHEVYMTSFSNYGAMYNACCRVLTKSIRRIRTEKFDPKAELDNYINQLETELKASKDQIAKLRRVIVMYSHSISSQKEEGTNDPL